METLSVGVLRQNKNAVWKQPSTFATLFYVAAHFETKIFAFSPDDVLRERKKILGTFLINGKKVIQETDFPQVIDNSPLDERHDELMSFLDQESLLVRHRLDATKKQTYDRIMQGGIYKHLLIPTHNVQTEAQVFAYLDEYEGRVIVKPLRGSRGSGVLSLETHEQHYRVIEKTGLTQFDKQGFQEYLRTLFRHRRYILQPYVHSRTHYNFPFDIRIHARRGANGAFKVHLFPRIGNPKGILSNISSGGFSMEVDTFLQMEFPNCWQDIKQELLQLGYAFPEYYQRFFDVPLFDVGMDMGITSKPNGYALHLFEVNNYIDGPFHVLEDASTHFEYYRFLYEREQRVLRRKVRREWPDQES